MSIVICLNKNCEYIRDEVCPIDESNCRIKMWDEVSDCPESIVESQPAESKNCRNGTDTQQLKAKILAIRDYANKRRLKQEDESDILDVVLLKLSAV